MHHAFAVSRQRPRCLLLPLLPGALLLPPPLSPAPGMFDAEVLSVFATDPDSSECCSPSL
jgi:hypothetical protein